MIQQHIMLRALLLRELPQLHVLARQEHLVFTFHQQHPGNISHLTWHSLLKLPIIVQDSRYVHIRPDFQHNKGQANQQRQLRKNRLPDSHMVLVHDVHIQQQSASTATLVSWGLLLDKSGILRGLVNLHDVSQIGPCLLDKTGH